MLDIINNCHQELAKFNDITFDQELHQYTINNQMAKSVTQVLSNYKREFDKLYWAEIKAKELNISVAQLLEQWENNSKISMLKGTLVHQFIEAKLTNIEFNYPDELIIENFGFDPIQSPFNNIIQLVEKFFLDSENKLIPVASEQIIGDYNFLIGGTIDQLFYNHKSQQIEIWDWKTNKRFNLESKYCHMAPLEHIPDSEYDFYSLQLSFYKYIIEANTNLKLGTCYLAWFNENANNYKIYPAKYYKNEIIAVLNSLTVQN
jgi:hypothetical protein